MKKIKKVLFINVLFIFYKIIYKIYEKFNQKVKNSIKRINNYLEEEPI